MGSKWGGRYKYAKACTYHELGETINSTHPTSSLVSPMSTREIQRVAICGGGLGGLTLAAVLNQNSDIHVDIYEAKPSIASLGAGIAIWKRTWEVFQELGLEEEMAKRKLRLPQEGEIRGPTFRKGDQPEDGFDFHSHMMPYGPTAIARPILLEILQARLSDKTNIYTSKRLLEYRTDTDTAEPIELVFDDGSTGRADIVIGADGVHSMTRAKMYRLLESADQEAGSYDKFIDPIWSGTYAYRAQVDLVKFKEKYPDHKALDNPRIWLGKNKHVVSHPLGNIIHLVCYHTVDTGEGTPYDGPWVKNVLPEEVIDTYEGWEPNLHLEKPSRWAIHVIRPIPLSVFGRVGLLGDAAHAMTPHQGVGGGQAIEFIRRKDAYILGHLLAYPKANLQTIDEVLRVYQEIRLPFAAKAAERSRENGLIYEFIHPDYPVKPDATAEDLKVLGNVIRASFEWLAQGGCNEDRKRAEDLLSARLAGN
ncbi:hypothetical protein D9619_001981 [Psilocybe cf. subviscida]|uniref:FAD-binding domain-containing protein n=1 Tax=Psilocybe cf. subviscida TaxID=2480587 RepID=A0A8H5BEB3_9AGAR|nr:hypothetical protein D9619_001981 [Psilocybe cf. subviscida]